MYQQLKSEIKEIIEIVNQCPETLKEKCFELLLENFLSSNSIKNKTRNDSIVDQSNTPLAANAVEVAYAKEIPLKSGSTEEITPKDFHVKIQRFLSSNNIDIAVINQLYYKESGKLMPLYEALKSTKMAECQIRLALLTAFENSFENGNGEMVFNGETIRQRCQDMKCYDGPNFAKNFKISASLFDNWNEKYDKKSDYSLSLEAKKELAAILTELAEGE